MFHQQKLHRNKYLQQSDFHKEKNQMYRLYEDKIQQTRRITNKN